MSNYNQPYPLPSDTDTLLDLAMEHHQANRLPEAVALYESLLQLRPDDADVLHLSALAAIGLGHHEQAVARIDAAIDGKQDCASFWNSRAMAYHGLGALNEAEVSFRRALALEPDSRRRLLNLAVLLYQAGRLAEAEFYVRRALRAHGAGAAEHNLFGLILKNSGRTCEAEQAFRHALAFCADDVASRNNLGLVLVELGRLDEAEHCFREVLVRCGDHPQAHCNLGMIMLAKGNWERGWEEYEWRFLANGVSAGQYDRPRWQGENLAGKTLLVTGEQGLGDMLQFVRYVSLAARQAQQVILLAPPELRRLLASVEGVTRVLTPQDALPPFDLWCPLLSLPLQFGTRLDCVPAQAPYLRVMQDDFMVWQQRVQTRLTYGHLSVGLVWAGRGRHEPAKLAMGVVNARRNLLLQQLAALGRVAGVTFFSLQLGEPAMEVRKPPLGMRLVDCTADIQDFADTAALVANLDLVISVDTAVAHLAGALGKPVWLLNRFDSCWRWLDGRNDSPWYPGMRLFRQTQRGDWAPVINEVAGELARLAAGWGRNVTAERAIRE